MKLIVQPDAGIAPVVTAIKQARKSIDVLIFRLDRLEIARALEAAVARGVRVRALTAHQNRGGTKILRKLETGPSRGRCHRVADRRRSRPLPRQDDDRRRPDPSRLRLQLHAPRHGEEPQLRHRDEEPQARQRSDEAVRSRLRAAALHVGVPSASSSARKMRASAWPPSSRARESSS